MDFPKFEQQIVTAHALVRDLLATDSPPVFDTAAPVVTYNDAAELSRIVNRAQVDLGLFPPDQQVAIAQFQIVLQAIVDAGPDTFDAADVATLLGGAAMLVDSLANLECDPFLAEE